MDMSMADDISQLSDAPCLLTIDFTGCDKVTCQLCGSHASDDTPLTNMVMVTMYGGKHPWAKYRIIKCANGKPISRRPTGKNCAICRNVFNALGLEDIHATCSQYYVFVCRVENASQFRSFIVSVGEWITQHNKDDTGTVRLKGTKELLDKFTTLAIEQKETTAFKGPEWDFVCKDSWDPKKDGEYDPSKVTIAEVFGAAREGVWVLRGREGVFRWEAQDRLSSTQQTLEDDGKGPFAAERLKNKLSVLRGSRQQFEKARASKCVDRSAESAVDVQGMLELLKSHGVNAEKQDAREQGPATGASGENSDDDDSEDGKVVKPTMNRLASLFAAPKSGSSLRNTKAKSSPSKTTPAPVARQSPVKNVGASNATSVPAPSGRNLAAKKGQTSRKALSEAVSLDGRTRRIKESLAAVADTCRVSLEHITFEEDLANGGDKQKKAALAECFKTKARKLSKIEGDINQALFRIKNSASQEHLADVKDMLANSLTLAGHMQRFQALVVSPATCTPETYFEVRGSLTNSGVTMGRSYYEFDLSLQGRQAILRNDAKSLCHLCMEGSPTIAQLKVAGCSLPELESLSGGLVLDAVLEVGGKLTAAEVPKKVCESQTKATIQAIITQVQFYKEHEDGFLVQGSIHDRLQLLLSFIEPWGVSVKKLGDDVEALERWRTSGQDGGPIVQFLCEGNIPMKLVAHAESVHKSREHEIQQEESVIRVEELGATILAGIGFYDAASDSVCHDALKAPVLNDFEESVKDTNALLANKQTAKKRKGSGLALPLFERVQQVQNAVWAYTKKTFEHMYALNVEDVASRALEALKSGGTVEQECEDLSVQHSILDFATFSEQIHVSSVKAAPILQTDGAKGVKFEARIDELTKKGAQFLSMMKFVLASNCPKIAALNELTASDAEVRKYSAFDVADLVASGLSDDSATAIASQLAPLLAGVSDARSSVVYAHVMTLFDACVDGSCSGVTEESVASLAKRLPKDCMYRELINEFLMIAVRVGSFAQSSHFKTANGIFKTIERAEAAMTKVIDHVGLDRMALFWGGERMSNIMTFFTSIRRNTREVVVASRDKVVTEIDNNISDLEKRIANLDPQAEKEFLDKMRDSARHLAKSQKEIETLMVKITSAHEALGTEFAIADPALYQRTSCSKGIAIFLIGYYTAVTLYRSPFMGKNNDIAKKTAANLSKVLQSVNADKFAVDAERISDVPLAEEMRKFANVPLPPIVAIAVEDAAGFMDVEAPGPSSLANPATLLTPLLAPAGSQPTATTALLAPAGSQPTTPLVAPAGFQPTIPSDLGGDSEFDEAMLGAVEEALAGSDASDFGDGPTMDDPTVKKNSIDDSEGGGDKRTNTRGKRKLQLQEGAEISETQPEGKPRRISTGASIKASKSVEAEEVSPAPEVAALDAVLKVQGEAEHSVRDAARSHGRGAARGRAIKEATHAVDPAELADKAETSDAKPKPKAKAKGGGKAKTQPKAKPTAGAKVSKAKAKADAALTTFRESLTKMFPSSNTDADADAAEHADGGPDAEVAAHQLVAFDGGPEAHAAKHAADAAVAEHAAISDIAPEPTGAPAVETETVG